VKRSDTAPHQQKPPPAPSTPAGRRAPGAEALSALRPIETPALDLQRLIMDFIELLDKEYGQNPNLVKGKLSLTSESKRTLLHVSAALGFHQVVKALVDHRVDLNLRDMSGFGALHYAALNGRFECAKLLVDGGANIETMDRWGLLAQEVAVDTNHHDIGQLLEARRSNPPDTIKGTDCEDLDTGVLAVKETAHLPAQRPGATGSAREHPDELGGYITYWCRIFRLSRTRSSS